MLRHVKTTTQQTLKCTAHIESVVTVHFAQRPLVGFFLAPQGCFVYHGVPSKLDLKEGILGSSHAGKVRDRYASKTQEDS